jgi:O-antigen biosynthesis protein
MPQPIKIREIATLRQTIPPDLHAAYPPLPVTIAVTVIVPTFDRPESLRRCLTALTQQVSQRVIHFLVIDNHPQSDQTPAIVAAFPQVQLVSEPQAGSSRARNTGIRSVSTEIVVMVDDDVVVPPDWLERLLAPLNRPDVCAVTGQVLPLEVKTYAQQLFEVFGGLGRGWERREVDRAWADRHRCHAVPSWELGATANAAFRTAIFRDPAIGEFHEALGGGMPSQGGEDTYFLYKVLQGGGTIIYEPTAWLWHEHRPNITAFTRQMQGYRQGHMAHHLTALVEAGDWRSLIHLLFWVPLHDGGRIKARLCRQSDYPLGLVGREIWGSFTGVWCWWQSRRLWRQRQRCLRER